MSLLIQEYPLIVLPSLAVKIGLNEAILLQQVHYWLSNDNAGVKINGHKWVYNSVEQWNNQFPFWSPNTLRRAINNLREKGYLIAEKLSNDPRDNTLYYRIDEAFIFSQLHLPKMGKPPTQNGQITNNTETTTYINEQTPKKHTTQNLESAFSIFWTAGMRKVSKKPAFDKFKILVRDKKVDPAEFATLLAKDIKRRLAANQMGFAQMHPTTYLNQERWEDELIANDSQTSGEPAQGTNNGGWV